MSNSGFLQVPAEDVPLRKVGPLKSGPTRVLFALFSFSLICLAIGILLHSFTLMFHVTNTDAAIYRQDVGRILLLVGVIVMSTTAVGLAMSRNERPDWARTSKVAPALLVLSLLVGVGGEIWAYGKMHPFRPEQKVIESFVPPPGSELIDENASASYFPTAGRHWRLSTTSLDEAQELGRLALEAWADQGTTRLEFPEVPNRFLAEKGNVVALMVITDVRRSNEIQLKLGVKRKSIPT